VDCDSFVVLGLAASQADTKADHNGKGTDDSHQRDGRARGRHLTAHVTTCVARVCRWISSWSGTADISGFCLGSPGFRLLSGTSSLASRFRLGGTFRGRRARLGRRASFGPRARLRRQPLNPRLALLQLLGLHLILLLLLLLRGRLLTARSRLLCSQGEDGQQHQGEHDQQ
jgi:hypothetical protein